ncbi:hypothetical protein JX266_012090 [Neoarthrinium moseri]|nr:hypothetical protein JX266_012090 [Neoarthrinium moseri]
MAATLVTPDIFADKPSDPSQKVWNLFYVDQSDLSLLSLPSGVPDFHEVGKTAERLHVQIAAPADGQRRLREAGIELKQNPRLKVGHVEFITKATEGIAVFGRSLGNLYRRHLQYNEASRQIEWSIFKAEWKYAPEDVRQRTILSFTALFIYNGVDAGNLSNVSEGVLVQFMNQNLSVDIHNQDIWALHKLAILRRVYRFVGGYLSQEEQKMDTVILNVGFNARENLIMSGKMLGLDFHPTMKVPNWTETRLSLEQCVCFKHKLPSKAIFGVHIQRLQLYCPMLFVHSAGATPYLFCVDKRQEVPLELLIDLSWQDRMDLQLYHWNLVHKYRKSLFVEDSAWTFIFWRTQQAPGKHLSEYTNTAQGLEALLDQPKDRLFESPLYYDMAINLLWRWFVVSFQDVSDDTTLQKPYNSNLQAFLAITSKNAGRAAAQVLGEMLSSLLEVSEDVYEDHDLAKLFRSHARWSLFGLRNEDPLAKRFWSHMIASRTPEVRNETGPYHCLEIKCKCSKYLVSNAYNSCFVREYGIVKVPEAEEGFVAIWVGKLSWLVRLPRDILKSHLERDLEECELETEDMVQFPGLVEAVDALSIVVRMDRTLEHDALINSVLGVDWVRF